MEALHRFLGLATLIALVAGFVCFGLAGVPDGAGADEVAEAVGSRGYGLAAASLLFIVAGVCLALFLTGLADRWGLARWTRTVATIWGGAWAVAGLMLMTVGEMAGYQDNPDGARTVITLTYLMVVNPAAAVLGGAFALAMGRAQEVPRLMRRLSMLLGSVAVAAGALGSVGGVGLLGLGPAVLWLVLVSAWAAWPRAGARHSHAEGPGAALP